MADMANEKGGNSKKENGGIGKREALKMMKRKHLMMKNEERSNLRKIKEILRKELHERTNDDVDFLHRYSKVANDVLKRKEKKRLLDERTKEKEDNLELLQKKCAILAEAIRCAKHMVVYTGAGISTAASIPDYRGPDGIWTKLSKGEEFKVHSLCDAEPTLTHMSLVSLYQHDRVKHVVSQNCDGLHIRSGLPPEALSEVHGNMFAEACEECDPQRVYWRLFDVTENTGLRRHSTNRKCHLCRSKLFDTIVHFGEKRELSFPQNWEAAFAHAKKADTILCLGSSLKVLKSYHGLWGMNKVKLKRPDLYIINLQWTPKDNMASLKINGKVDDVMTMVMDQLKYSIPRYIRSGDPLFKMQTPLTRSELNSHTTKLLSVKIEDDISTSNRDRSEPNGDCRTTKGECSISECDVSFLKEEFDVVLDDAVQNENKTVVMRPGWFGKGLRKIKKRKRK